MATKNTDINKTALTAITEAFTSSVDKNEVRNLHGKLITTFQNWVSGGADGIERNQFDEVVIMEFLKGVGFNKTQVEQIINNLDTSLDEQKVFALNEVSVSRHVKKILKRAAYLAVKQNMYKNGKIVPTNTQPNKVKPTKSNQKINNSVISHINQVSSDFTTEIAQGLKDGRLNINGSQIKQLAQDPKSATDQLVMIGWAYLKSLGY